MRIKFNVVLVNGGGIERRDDFPSNSCFCCIGTGGVVVVVGRVVVVVDLV